MSYCRWSSDDWLSDLYVYESTEGICVHVAANRKPEAFAAAIPPAVPCDPHDHAVFARWFERGQDVMALLDQFDSVPIELPHAGESATFDDHFEAADAVDWLAALGYHVPHGVAAALRSEAP